MLDKVENGEASADKRILFELRRMIMDEVIAPGEKLTEVAVAEQFRVSRTPARLALGALEAEGLIKKRQGRGFTVQELDLGDTRYAYEVRGVLEGLAAGTLAKAGMMNDVRRTLVNAIEEMDAALDSDMQAADRVAKYQEFNAVFHGTIMRSCGNPYIAFAFDRMETLPLVKPGTVVFNEENSEQDLLRIRFGNMQHRLIFDAIAKRDPQRAEAMMREHANQTLVYSALFSPEGGEMTDA